MFTGLVKCLGTVKDAKPFGKGRRFAIDLGGLSGIEVGQSVAVNGTCLTVTTTDGAAATFDAVTETVSRTNLGLLKTGDRVNLEPALRAGDALDGHLVQGHIDAMAKVLEIDAANPSARVVRIELPKIIRHLVADKGSIAVDGISLTVSAVGDDWFTVAIIPHSWQNSTLCQRRVGDGVNLEADVLARYAARIMQYASPSGSGGISETFLRENGFA